MITPLMPTYARLPIAFERAEGMYMYDTNGKKYMDFYSGIGVMALGHCHPHVVDALCDQAKKLWHTANTYQIPLGEKLASRIIDKCNADTVFFTNSGAEAIECAIKMVRKYHHDKGNPGKYRIVTMATAFHGRTLAGIAAAGQEKMITGFEPVPKGFDLVPFNDMEALRSAITEETGAIMVEPVQGEGGIKPIPLETLQEMRKICDEKGILLVFDEIQCGMGRTGKLFAYQWADIDADIIASAKGIGGGFPLGACFATEDAASGMIVGTHGSTYGGNPLAMAVGNAVMDILLEDGFLEHVQKMGDMLGGRLAGLQQRFPEIITEVRGKGLMRGLRMPDIPTKAATVDLINRGLITAVAGDMVVRMLPPLIVNEDDIEYAIGKWEEALTDWSENGAPV
ncbi:aspartate aminotransferase family protein [Temperatibacter marinus]|uniref:Acetylornithine aminotransferase n=1 Tax=Temperatibacter marinus TaxID=1456591 RepID=A0AA52EJM6_9PROT|nr:aspartate aminotransferase family protein [Temperatibacter marinus]WND03251.1 aspartate aminotransferase family protein [Temperatibacter marinus]